jgi:hypothetical protein
MDSSMLSCECYKLSIEMMDLASSNIFSVLKALKNPFSFLVAMESVFLRYISLD